MAIDLVDLVKGHLTPDVIQQAATYVGESGGATQKTLAGIVPSLVGALTSLASTNDGAQQLARMLDAGQYDGSGLSSVPSLFGGGVATQSAASAGQGILDALFGARIGSVGDLIARFGGVRTDSASSLLALTTPLVLHVLGQQRASIGPSVSALASLLGEQKSFLAGLVPADVSARRPGWIVPLVILGLLALGLAIWLGRPTSSTEPVRHGERKINELYLPGRVRISVPEGSFNFNLASWLASTTDTRVPKRFVFEDVNFEAGSTRLTPGSVATLNSLITVLTVYSAVSVALEGHTDSTGDPITNKKLSLDRALAVKELMVEGGIRESRITSVGHGQDRPIASNDTEQGRAKNRRLELVVVKR